MKKVISKWTLLICLIIFITGCTTTENEIDVKERSVDVKGIKTLTCNIVDNEEEIAINMDVDISKDYGKNKFLNGTFMVKLTLSDEAEAEDVNMLKNISMCSNDVMGELINYGQCDTTFLDKSLISTLTLDIDKMNSSTNISLEEIKSNIENTSHNGNCVIKQKDE